MKQLHGSGRLLLLIATLWVSSVVAPGVCLAAAADGPAAAPDAVHSQPVLPPRPPQIGPAGREAVLAYRLKNYVPPETKIGDGYVDGGRKMKMHGDGRVSSSREIITVDRTRDAELRKHLEFARSDEVMKLNELDRATRLARHVAWLMTPKEGYKHLEAKAAALDKEHRNKEVLLGDVCKITGGAGVCRHRSLLFKLLADEAGLKVSLVRGRHGRDPKSAGSHAWNELRSSDGKVLIVDVMNPLPDFHFPDDKSRQAGRYFTQARQPYYPSAAMPAQVQQSAAASSTAK
jgi:hypothetical protein